MNGVPTEQLEKLILKWSEKNTKMTTSGKEWTIQTTAVSHKMVPSAPLAIAEMFPELSPQKEGT